MNAVPGRILLATDGSEDATLAARAAVDIASKVGSELHVVHVWAAVPSARFEAFIRTQLEQEAQGLLDEQVEEIERAGGPWRGPILGKEGQPTRSPAWPREWAPTW